MQTRYFAQIAQKILNGIYCMCDNDTATTTTSQVMKKRGEGRLKLLEAPDIIKMSPMKIGSAEGRSATPVENETNFRVPTAI